MAFKIKANSEFYNTPVTELNLSVRATNVLCRGRIFTLDELTDRWNTLDKLRSCGKTTVSEIKNKFIEYYIDTVLEKEPEKVALFMEGVDDVPALREKLAKGA